MLIIDQAKGWAFMEPRRIILAQVPRFLRETLERAFDKAPGIRIVAGGADLAQLAAALDRTGAQWVIVSLPPNGIVVNGIDRLLAAHPSVRLMNVASDGSHVTMQWVEPRQQTLDTLSMSELIELLSMNPTIA
jgi:hypothetical protein